LSLRTTTRGGECLVEIGDEIFRSFESNGETNEFVADTEGLSNLGFDIGVGGGGGMRDEGFESAETFGTRAELDVVERADGSIEASLEFEGDHTAAVRLLAVGEFFLRP
jgi:hypothetical protein